MMLLLRRPPTVEGAEGGRQAVEGSRSERRPEKAGVRSFAECLCGTVRRSGPEGWQASRSGAAVSEAEPRRREDKAVVGTQAVAELRVRGGAAVEESVAVVGETMQVESGPVWAKAVKERLVEGIVRLVLESWAAERRGVKREGAEAAESAADFASLVEGLKGELRRFDTGTLTELLGRLRASGNPWETLKEWMAVRVPERRWESLGWEVARRSSEKAEVLRPSGAFVVTEEGKVAVNREKVEVVDRRERPEARGWAVRREGAEVVRSKDGRPVVVSAAAQAGERRVEAVKESVSVPKVWLREAEGREAKGGGEVGRTVEPRPASGVERTNRIFAELARHARMMLEDRRSVLEVELRPPHLGKVTLKLEVSAERLTARLMAQNDGTGEMLRQNMGDLYQAFREAGFDLSRLDVQVGSGSEGRGEGFGDAAVTGVAVGGVGGEAVEAAGLEGFVFAAEMSAEAGRLDAWA